MQALAGAVCGLLGAARCARGPGRALRAFAQAHYDLRRVCLPRQLEWVQGLG